MELSVQKNGISIVANIHRIGEDVLISVYGGDKAHIGGCILADENEIKILSLGEHKDHIAFEIMAKIITKHIRKNLCITGGIHIENITKEQIEIVLDVCKILAFQIVSYLNK